MEYEKNKSLVPPVVENPWKFLLDSGLIFEINRVALHPLGMAITVNEDDETGEVTFHSIQDFRDDPEGMAFAKETFEDGVTKLNKYLNSGGAEHMIQRRDVLGFMQQGEMKIDFEDWTGLPLRPPVVLPSEHEV